jgi:penicillin-binding protein 2
VSESGGPLRGLHLETLAAIREGLELAISDPQGTGYKTVRHPDVMIAGKTGTAEVGGGRPDHAWFAGYVPADQPRVAFVVVLEHGGSGGKAAGPVARAFVQKLLDRQRISPTAPHSLAQQQAEQ